jgi:hypothetical protein
MYVQFAASFWLCINGRSFALSSVSKYEHCMWGVMRNELRVLGISSLWLFVYWNEWFNIESLFLPTVNCKIRYEEDFILRDIEGFRHLEGINSKTKLSVTRMYINLTNLFNGDPVLSKFMQCKQLTGPLLANVLPCAKFSLAQRIKCFPKIFGNLIICGPCIVIHLRNTYQQDALFHSQFIVIITLYTFWASVLFIIRR